MSDFIGRKVIVPYNEALYGWIQALGTVVDIHDERELVTVSIEMSSGNSKIFNYAYRDVVILGPVGELLYT